VADRSTPKAVSGGRFDGNGASAIHITSKEEDFGGLYIKRGKSIRTLSNATIELSGNASEEGAAEGVTANQGATLILKNAHITTSAAGAPAVLVQNRSMPKGAIQNASLTIESSSKWTATSDSSVVLVGTITPTDIDAPSEVTILVTAGKDCPLKGAYKLANSGIMNVVSGS
jgi:hypothetical protein